MAPYSSFLSRLVGSTFHGMRFAPRRTVLSNETFSDRDGTNDRGHNEAEGDGDTDRSQGRVEGSNGEVLGNGSSTERTPLLPSRDFSTSKRGLGGSERDNSTTKRKQKKNVPKENAKIQGGHSTPLPKFQIFILCLMRFTEPIVFTYIFPFVNQMIERNHVTSDPASVGYYAGLIESLLSLTTFVTIFHWGRLSDRIGRKPVLCFGLLGVSLSALGFGLSGNFWQMVVSRCIAGGLNGNVAIVKSTLGELTDPTNQARAFSFLPLCWGVGCVLGPLLGGFLADPVRTFPSFFPENTFFDSYPYFLPSAVAAIFPLSGAIVGWIWLDETLPSKLEVTKSAKKFGDGNGVPVPTMTTTTTTNQAIGISSSSPSSSSVANRHRQEEQDSKPLDESDSADRLENTTTASTPDTVTTIVKRPPPPPLRSLLTPEILILMLNYSLLALITISLDPLLTLWSYTPVSLGGLSLPISTIGLFLSLAGFGSIFVQLILFPWVHDKIGTVKLYISMMAFYPLIFAVFMLGNPLAKKGDKKGVWTVLGVVIGLKVIANMVFAANMILVNQSATSRDALGAINGLAQACASLMRGVGPAMATSLFALSVQHPKLGGGPGNLVFLIMVALSCVAFGLSFLLRDNTPEWQKDKVEGDDDNEGRSSSEESEEEMNEQEALLSSEEGRPRKRKPPSSSQLTGFTLQEEENQSISHRRSSRRKSSRAQDEAARRNLVREAGLEALQSEETAV